MAKDVDKAQKRPPEGGTPGGASQASQHDPGNNSPGAPPGIKGEGWATLGFLEEIPPDPYANLTESDSLEGDPEQCHIDDHIKQSQEFQRPRIKPLKSEWV